MSMKPGKCVCGKTMAKGKVISSEGGKAVVAVGKEKRTFNTVGQYACACGSGCGCNTISQKPGKCACGKPMEKSKVQ
jgi:hypothetical protein